MHTEFLLENFFCKNCLINSFEPEACPIENLEL